MPEYSINDQTEHIIGEVCYRTVPGYVVSPLDTSCIIRRNPAISDVRRTHLWGVETPSLSWR